jgi:hypothetical protein
MHHMEDYKVTARFVDGSTAIYDALDCGVARSVYYGFVKDEACVEVSYRISSGAFDRFCEVGAYKADVERFTASEK